MEPYQPIQSFTLDHDVMQPGLYCLGVRHGVYTYDMRLKKPNGGDYVSNAALHSLEHLFATVVRNSAQADNVIYFGPMGCRTGCYLLLYDIRIDEARALVIDCLRKCLDFHHVPGSAPIECGNYAEHDLLGAQRVVREYLNVLA